MTTTDERAPVCVACGHRISLHGTYPAHEHWCIAWDRDTDKFCGCKLQPVASEDDDR